MIVTVGEVVWDCFPDRQVLGGAPVNVAYHLDRLGVKAVPVTRVGQDDLGRQTRAFLAQAGVDCAGIQEDPELPTGRVEVRFDARGEPCFEIMGPAAWDAIAWEPAAALVAGQAYALVFGTLAQRDKRSRSTIERLAAGAETCYYDVNLRPPHTPVERVAVSLEWAQVVKMNEEELALLGRELGLAAPTGQETAERLRRRFGVQTLLVTQGEQGAWLVDDDGLLAVAGLPVAVADPVGAGDAFLAAYIAAAEAGADRQERLRRANRHGALVASLPGGMPELPPEA